MKCTQKKTTTKQNKTNLKPLETLTMPLGTPEELVYTNLREQRYYNVYKVKICLFHSQLVAAKLFSATTID